MKILLFLIISLLLNSCVSQHKTSCQLTTDGTNFNLSLNGGRLYSVTFYEKDSKGSVRTLQPIKNEKGSQQFVFTYKNGGKQFIYRKGHLPTKTVKQMSKIKVAVRVVEFWAIKLFQDAHKVYYFSFDVVEGKFIQTNEA